MISLMPGLEEKLMSEAIIISSWPKWHRNSGRLDTVPAERNALWHYGLGNLESAKEVCDLTREPGESGELSEPDKPTGGNTWKQNVEH